MGKYLGSNEIASATIGPLGCAGLPGMYANDVVGKGCWAVSGEKVPIGDTYASIHAGFEIINFNFRVDGTSPSVPTQNSLPGSFEA